VQLELLHVSVSTMILSSQTTHLLRACRDMSDEQFSTVQYFVDHEHVLFLTETIIKTKTKTGIIFVKLNKN